MEIFYVILALILGLVAGFVLGVRVKYESFKAQVEKSRRVTRQPADDATSLLPGLDEPRSAVIDQTVAFAADYTGDVFVTLWLPTGTEVADTDVVITWGAARGTITLPALSGSGVTLKFTKGSVDTEDAMVQVHTSVPTCRFASLNTAPPRVPVREDIAWA
jgi:hypothetical protein